MDFLEAFLATMMPVFLAGAGWLAFQAKRRIEMITHVEMEAYHRETLHMAIATGVRLGVAKLNGDAATVQEHMLSLKRQAVEYARRSSPDAIAYLGATFDRLIDLAEAKIEEIYPAPYDDDGVLFFDEESSSSPDGEQLSLEV